MTVLSEIQVLQEWLDDPATQEGLQRCANNAIAAIDANLSLRVPRTEQERQHAFAGWLDGYRAKIGLEIQKQFATEFPGISERMKNKNTIQEIVDAVVWPRIEAEVCRRFEQKFIPYAVLSQAIAWGRKNVGDVGLYGQPQRVGNVWRVALGVKGYGENLGQIILDTDGNINPAQTTTRQEILDKIHAHASVPAETVHA